VSGVNRHLQSIDNHAQGRRRRRSQWRRRSRPGRSRQPRWWRRRSQVGRHAYWRSSRIPSGQRHGSSHLPFRRDSRHSRRCSCRRSGASQQGRRRAHLQARVISHR
ncbi:hypothetical protein PENTCL1PPCAC_13059, partial [Pristionchus entomophagus]